MPRAPLAWLQLKKERLRFAVALAGVAFAVVLILMQLGFREAMFASAVRWLERCLRSLLACPTPGLEIVLLDNASTDGSVALARGLSPRLRVLQNERNLGFCAGHNVGTHRMGTSATDSIVDVDQRCWDHENLYLIGCGSMPTIATSNPSLTMAALALRSVGSLCDDLGLR